MTPETIDTDEQSTDPAAHVAWMLGLKKRQVLTVGVLFALFCSAVSIGGTAWAFSHKLASMAPQSVVDSIAREVRSQQSALSNLVRLTHTVERIEVKVDAQNRLLCVQSTQLQLRLAGAECPKQ